jgi:hypothetical protein
MVVDSLRYCLENKGLQLFGYVIMAIENYQMWTHENHAMVIYSPSFALEKLDYLHHNPVRAGWVRKPEDYVYSSASNYAGMESILKILLMDVEWKTY